MARNLILWMLGNVMLSDLNASSLNSDDWCPVTPPCSCYGVTVGCGNKNLTTFPPFRVSTIPGNYFYIDLEGNFLKSIPENAFENLKVGSDTKTTMYLHHNNLTQIHRNAFNGLDDSITYIRLDNNDLTDIPFALTKLHNLETLYLDNNPLSTLDNKTMQMLCKRLNKVTIGMHQFKQWPNELEYLTNLTELGVFGLNLTTLKTDAFKGQEITLHTLSIVNSSLLQIPSAICNLRTLTSFEFYNNNITHYEPLFEPCSDAMPSVRYVTLSDNNLQHMPDVFKIFPSTASLYLTNNQLSFIPWEYIPEKSALQILNLDYNSFTQIPQAFKKLSTLTDLQIGYNTLRSIQENDFSGMVNLQSLYLYVNPLEYIAPSAFRDNTRLFTLALGGTNLRHLPVSLVGLTQLRYFTVTDDPIVCNCGMSYLKGWNVTNINMNGYCDSTTVQIKQFLLNELPKCP